MKQTEERASTPRALVIGYGSPIRGDDAVGPLVIERLEREGVPAGVVLLSRHILTPDLAPELAAVDRVVFIDAAIGGTPGEIQCRRLSPALAPPVTVPHYLDPPELLAWTEHLYDRRPEAYLVSTPGQCFDFRHLELSDAVANVVDALAHQTRLLVVESRLAGRWTERPASY